MAPASSSEKRNDDTARSSPASAEISAAEAALKARLSRKRTKTGCLTCRKRRIKCGEERPVCNNCVKSKRNCEGYSQRVIFRHPPTFDYQPVANGAAHIVFQAAPVPNTPHEEVPPPKFEPIIYGQLRPRPPDHQYTNSDGDLARGHLPQLPIQPGTLPSNVYPRGSNDVMQSHSHFYPTPKDVRQHGQLHAQAPAQAQFAPPSMPPISSALPAVSMTMNAWAPVAEDPHYRPSISYSDPGLPPVTVSFDSVAQAYRHSVSNSSDAAQSRDNPHFSPVEHLGDQSQMVKAVAAKLDLLAPSPTSYQPARTFPFSQMPSSSAPEQWRSNKYVPRPELARPIDYEPPPVASYATQPVQPVHMHMPQQEVYDFSRHHYQHTPQALVNVTQSSVLKEAAVETQDDDYYDVDEEMDIDFVAIQQRGYQRQRALCDILALHQPSSGIIDMRRYDTFIYAGMLDRYRVEEVASPLKNPATARVFAHFISATGPSLSIFERHPRNTSVLFTEGSVPFSQQGLWTYTMPMAALRNQGLLHAMLALASLHIARLQNASVTPSMQHYAWALRRIHASVGKSKSRLKVTTIAASMLLGFYEVMTADHMKWNMHLAGSKQLFVETDFKKMTRQFRQMKIEKALRSQLERTHRHSMQQSDLRDGFIDQIPDVDERIVSQMLGWEVRYDDQGHTEPPTSDRPVNLDLSRFGILKDLYWWYCKQDAYQSIVSGNPLLMDFNRWADCAPRAPLGKSDAVYGSFDHLILLLGRIADFAVRDRARKLKQVEANGGQWRPAPGMKIARPQPPQGQTPHTPVSASTVSSMSGGFPPPQHAATVGSAGSNTQPTMPQFYGMAPAPRSNVQMPSSYAPMYPVSTPQSTGSPTEADYDLHAETVIALAEHDRIRNALQIFCNSLGTAFQPLTSEFQPPMETAFGTALFYRSYDIGCLWAMYYMALIIAIRSHPHMPPAAHMAAGVAASDTAFYANEIGRIAAGIVPGEPDQALNPSLGAALCESCMPSFFAAVQYQNPQQRHETVTRIFSIAKRSGWGSAELIAHGCETAWVKAAEAGRGPPYQRIASRQEQSEDPRLNGSWERLDPQAAPDESNDSDRRLVRTNPHARLHWAIGVMGLEDDLTPSPRRES